LLYINSLAMMTLPIKVNY